MVSTDAFPQRFPGRVSVISPSADPKSRVFSVEVTIDNATNQLRSGMIASLAIDGEVLPQAVVAVPLSAVIRDPEHAGGFAVMTLAGDSDTESAHLRAVELGDVYGNMIGARQGLKPGDRVVTTGVTLLSNGDTVRVIR
jgi:multidrug efflux system membrane fusion protein